MPRFFFTLNTLDILDIFIPNLLKNLFEKKDLKSMFTDLRYYFFDQKCEYTDIKMSIVSKVKKNRRIRTVNIL